MKCGYSVNTTAAVALVAATAKSVLGVRSGATFGADLRGFTVGFDGVTAANVPVLVELCYATFATNAPGTNSTPRTVVQNSGRVTASGMTAASNWTAEPTVLTVLREALLTPNGGLMVIEFALDKSWDTALNEGFVIRCTAPQVVNVRASMDLERA